MNSKQTKKNQIDNENQDLYSFADDVSSIQQKIKHQAFSSKKFDKKIKNEIEGDKKHITNEFFLKDSY